MIEIRRIGVQNAGDINLPNEPFPLFGRMCPRYENGVWNYSETLFETKGEMCFPDESYDYSAMCENSVFLGAYDGEKCVSLAILQQGFFKYMYLYDLKVNAAYRGKGIGSMLIGHAKNEAAAAGYRGIYTQGQDNNLAACRFYLKNGFRIGGLDTELYKGTRQEGKSDIIFYLDC